MTLVGETQPSELVSALSVAENLRLIGWWVRKVTWSSDGTWVEEVVAETALDLLGRHQRHPEAKQSKWVWLKYATREAIRQAGAANGKVSAPNVCEYDLAVAPNQHEQERYQERQDDEEVEDLTAEFERESPVVKRERERLTRIALGTSLDPLLSVIPISQYRRRVL